MKKTFAMLVACLSLSFGVSASSNQGNFGKKQLNFAELKQSCENPKKFHAQVPPKNIKVICRDYRLSWTETDAKVQTIDGRRAVTTSVISDKYNVSAQTYDIPAAKTAVNCPVYKQMRKTFKVQTSVSCADILAHKGKLVNFCLDVLNKSQDDDFEVGDAVATGKVFSSCGGKIIRQR